MNSFNNNEKEFDYADDKGLSIKLQNLKNRKKQLAETKKRLLEELTIIQEEQEDINSAITNIEKEIMMQDESLPHQELSKDNINITIHNELLKLKSFNERIDYITSIDINDKDILAILLKHIEYDDDYLFQCWIMDNCITSEKLLIDFIEHDFSDNNPFKFKLDLKIKAINHKLADEELLKTAIKSDEFDLRQATYNRAVNDEKFAHISKIIASQFEQDSNLLDLVDLNKLIMDLSHNIIPNRATKEEIEESIDKFYNAVKKSEDEEFIEEMSHVVELAKDNVDSYFS